MSKMTSANPFSGSTVRPCRVTALTASFSSWRDLSIVSPRAWPTRAVPATCASNDENRNRWVSWTYSNSESQRRKRVGMSSAVTRTSTSPTGLTVERSAIRLDIPSAAFANSSSRDLPYARMATSAVWSISSKRTAKAKARMRRSFFASPSDPAALPRPKDLVELDLEAHREAVLEDPRREPIRVEAHRDLVCRSDRREQHGLRLGAVRGKHAPCELVVLAVTEDELDFVVGL